MAARKLKIEINFAEDLNIIGISCHKIDYWIARELNLSLRINLSRENDLSVYNADNDITLNYPLFYFIKPETQTAFYLISNHNPEGKLFPGQKTFDYFLLHTGRMNEDDKTELIARIRKIPKVLTAHFSVLKKIKNLDEFISDLELHMIERKHKKE
jgi:hypothetical protein